MHALKQYAQYYTWSHVMTDGVMAHQDGAVSRLIEWDGLDLDMSTELDRERAWQRLYLTLGAIPEGYCAEFHWWREWDDELARAYLEQSEKMVRGGDFARALRVAQAEHLGPYGISNEVAVVLTKLPKSRFLFGAKRALLNQARDAQALNEVARHLLPNLPGARFADGSRYLSRIRQSYDHAQYVLGHPVAHDPRFLITEQLLSRAPDDSKGYVAMADHATKVLLVYMYPDAAPAWFLGLASLSIAMHVVHIVQPINTKAAMRSSERESNIAEGTLTKRGGDSKSVQMEDIADFRRFVTQNNLAVFQNAYIIHLHGRADEIDDKARVVKDWIHSHGGQVRDAPYVQLPYYRAAQPGQGYRVPVWRPDHALQVANMLPVQVYRQGDRAPESLRLGESGQLVGFNLSAQKIPHSFTIAMTGGGKGVDKVATIAESYPFGTDWYIAEIGESYRWVVEAFGGTYSKLDPNESVVNPLPPFAATAPVSDDNPYPLNAVLAGGTVNALAFLLTDGRTSLTVHEAAAGQAALQYLYAVPDATRYAPTLPEYLSALQEDLFENEQQAQAARGMAANLESFLNTTEGRIFSRQDNLNLSEGITGVDLKDVDRASPKLLQFYLVFLALRYSHLAFARRTPARVLLDEMHKFVATFPEVIGRLISELARMGRKDAAAIDIVTQGIQEIDRIEKEVLNSMRLRSLLYRPDEHDEIASRIDMPKGVLETWKSWKDPTSLTWRPAIRSIGSDYFNLHLTFPPMLLDLASTTDMDLTLKEEIGRETKDPFRRLELLRERRKKR